MLFLSFLGVILLLCWYAYNNTNRRSRVYQLVHKYYPDLRAFSISHQARQGTTLADSEFTYGEIAPASMMDILDLVRPHSHENIYDLGSGSGLVLLIATSYCKVKKIVGIEIVPELYQYSIDTLLGDNSTFSNIEIINANYLEYDISEADVVFVNAVTLNDEQFNQLQRQLNTLKKGARIILSSKQLTADNFTTIDKSARLMSWGFNSVFIYEKSH